MFLIFLIIDRNNQQKKLIKFSSNGLIIINNKKRARLIKQDWLQAINNTSYKQIEIIYLTIQLFMYIIMQKCGCF